MKTAVRHLRQRDAVLARVIAEVGPCALTYREPDFRALTRSIAGQQLNIKAAATIFARFEAACGDQGVTPERVLALRETTLKKAGLSAQKSSYIRDLARHVRDGRVVLEDLAALPDEEVVARLTEVKGIGVWTVHMFLIFALRRPDVMPVGDYGIRAAMQKLYQLDEMPKPAQMLEISAPWQPWRSIACWYLWRSLDGDAAL
jgi:DNA-3-methyladenine glycosylase II